MKAILVIDMPKSCWACPLWDKSDYADGCEAVGRKTHDIDHGAEREVWCPLKPLPPKLDANDWHRMFSGLFSEREAKGHGWNACLKEITGE